MIGGIFPVLTRNRRQEDNDVNKVGEKRRCLFRESLVTKACGAEEPC